MDTLQFLKNPIIISVIVIVLVFGYFYWEKSKTDDNVSIFEMEMSSYIIPLVAGAGAYFLMIIFNNGGINGGINGGAEELIEFTDSDYYSESTITPQSNDSFKLIGKNRIRLPRNDILIDISRF